MAGNQLSRDEVTAGNFRQIPSGNRVKKSLVASVPNTATSATVIGQIPAGSTIIGATIFSPVASDAATSSVISVGFSGGNGHELINAQDVKGASGKISPTIAAGQSFGAQSALKTITATITTVGAQTVGGPYIVDIEYV